MKSLWIAPLLALCFVVSCKKDKNEHPLSVDKTEISLYGFENSSASIQITTGTNWKITVEGNADWLQIEPSSGKGDATVQIKNKSNNVADIADINLTLSGEGSAPVTIKLTRKPLLHKALLNPLGGSDSEQFNHGVATPDGGYILVGFTESLDHDFSDLPFADKTAIAIKYSASGSLEWKKYYGGDNNDHFNSVIVTDDGGYLMVGSSLSSGEDFPSPNGEEDYWIVKTDRDGVKQWSRVYGSKEKDEAYSCVAVNGGYIIAGVVTGMGGNLTEHFGHSDAWILKLNLQGELIWQKSYGGSDHDGARSLAPVSDGNCVLAGNYGSADGNGAEDAQGSQDGWLLKFDVNNGNKIWSKRYGGSDIDVFYDVYTTENGDLVASGTSSSNDKQVDGLNHGYEDGLLVRTAGNGQLHWASLIGGQYEDRIEATVYESGKGFIVAGFSQSTELSGYKGGADAILCWLDTNGATLHHRLIGSQEHDAANLLLKTINNKYVTGGYFSQDNGDFTTHRGSSDCWSMLFE